MRKSLWLVVLFATAVICGGYVNAEQPKTATASDSDRVIAIDVLLLPDAKMLEKAKAANAKLRGNYPEGYTLGAEQAAHISLVHRYVREKDLPAVEAAVAKVAAKERPLDWELTATGFGSGMWTGLAITVISVENTPDMSRLGAEIVEAVEPFAVAEGTAAAFSTSKELPKIEPEVVSYVSKFVPNASGEKFKPHVTVGVAHEDFVDNLKAEPFEKYSFKAAGIAIYQLGSFGTAQKKLWEWNPK